MNRSAADHATEPVLGKGIYSIAEVACYTGLHYSTVRAWFLGRPDGTGRGPVFQSDYRRILGQYTVSFLDLIDALIAGQFRSLGVKMRVVRKAYARLAKALQSPHPFCHDGLYTDGATIIVRTANEIGDETLQEAISKQRLFLQILEHLKHVEYSVTSRLALRWRIAQGIVVDPQICRGKPVLEGKGIASFVLANAYRANGEKANLVADLFDVSADAVIDAARFEGGLIRQRAA